jgi:hypothetical protein
MAKPISPIFKFKGTIAGVTYVHSKAYKDHVRAAKGTYTPNVLTDALKESSSLLQICNQRARPLFRVLKEEHHDGRLWSRLVSLFFAELKAGRKINVQCLRNLDCNLQHKLDELLHLGYNIDVKKEKKKLGIHVRLEGHPKVEDQIPREGYQLRVVVIYPDFVKDKVRKEVLLGPVTKYKSPLKALELEVPMPSAKAPYIVLMGVSPVVKGTPLTIQSDTAMKVVAVSS